MLRCYGTGEISICSHTNREKLNLAGPKISYEK